MQSLIDASADVNHRNRTMGRTALHNASRRALPHLHHDWLTAATSAPGLGSLRSYLHRGRGDPCHVCTESAPRTARATISAGAAALRFAALAVATSAPGPLPGEDPEEVLVQPGPSTRALRAMC
jgi:hypothetical protein